MKKYFIRWAAIYEGFTYSETVTYAELVDRLADSTIQVIYIQAL